MRNFVELESAWWSIKVLNIDFDLVNPVYIGVIGLAQLGLKLGNYIFINNIVAFFAVFLCLKPQR